MHAGTCAHSRRGGLRERRKREGTAGSGGLKKQQPENPSLRSNKSYQTQVAFLSSKEPISKLSPFGHNVLPLSSLGVQKRYRSAAVQLTLGP